MFVAQNWHRSLFILRLEGRISFTERKTLCSLSFYLGFLLFSASSFLLGLQCDLNLGFLRGSDMADWFEVF